MQNCLRLTFSAIIHDLKLTCSICFALTRLKTDITRFLNRAWVISSVSADRNGAVYLQSKTVFWVHTSWRKFESILSLARMDKHAMEYAFSLWNNCDPKITFNSLKPDLRAPPTMSSWIPQLDWARQMRPHSVGGICTLSAKNWAVKSSVSHRLNTSNAYLKTQCATTVYVHYSFWIGLH